jgi:hypothetical protein
MTDTPFAGVTLCGSTAHKHKHFGGAPRVHFCYAQHAPTTRLPGGDPKAAELSGSAGTIPGWVHDVSMRVSRRILVVLPIIAVAAAAATLLSNDPGAEVPYVDSVLARTSAHVIYVLPPGTRVTVEQDAAVATARAYSGAPSAAVVHSARLGLYSDLSEQNLLVWVIDIEGVSRPAHQAVGQGKPRVITREVWMVSATAPGDPISSFAALPPLR